MAGPHLDPIVPAAIDWLDPQLPRSRQFDDRYVGEAGSSPQARHVFLAGNDLPARWQSRGRFTILETGFGLGGNFLATWATWRADPLRASRLFYVAIERHPPSAAELVRLHGEGEFATCVRELAEAWPPAVAGLHRLDFDAGRVVLLLGFGDVEHLLGEIEARIDAFYLDGFAPDRNPAMWSEAVARAMRRLAASDATLATWTVSRAVRDAWTAAGFTLERRAGLPPKRDMVAGRVTPLAYEPRESSSMRKPTRVALKEGSRVAVIGAGLAGAATTHALAARGFAVVLIDPLGIANATSGNRLAALQPVIARDENPTVRFTRTAYWLTVRRLDAMQAADADPLLAGLDGLLSLDDDADRVELAERLGLPVDHARAVDVTAARALTGADVAGGGWWFARGGWVSPRRWCARLIARHADRVTLVESRVERIDDTATGVRLTLDDGATIDAAAAVLANAADAALLSDRVPAMERLRGQVTELSPESIAAPTHPVAGDGYVMPSIAGSIMVGATYEFDGDAHDTRLRVESHRENLERIARLIGHTADVDAVEALDGRVGWRAINVDRMPSIGWIDGEANRLVVAGLGSRGLTWAALAGEQIAALLAGDPLPLERWLSRATDPMRFERRRGR